ncbi:unnamed protein product [Prunus brigantina]
MIGGEVRFGSDYLGLLVEAQHDANDNQRILVDEVVDDCKTFYMSGQETTTTLLSWTVLLLAVHTDWQEEARKEGQDVHLFKPERFSEGVAKATNNNIGAFITFRLGPRTCVDMNFGITEAKIALSMILQRYSFTLSPGYVHFPLHYLTVRPQHGVQPAAAVYLAIVVAAYLAIATIAATPPSITMPNVDAFISSLAFGSASSTASHTPMVMVYTELSTNLLLGFKLNGSNYAIWVLMIELYATS